ncbi:MAG: FAD-binding oxidoreductase [Gammaproteobacteria bacterium]|nr:FAD-binding oxidoreductase [Gammaproteobacteria bacterium]
MNEPGTEQLQRILATIVGPARLVSDREELAYLSQDAFWDDAVAAVAIRPENRQQLGAALAAISAAGHAVIPRGGGMSYTRGYVPHLGKSVLVDCRDLNRIVEINAEDLYITAEAGCTWMQLYEALKAKGLRTPYFGPMSGMFATVGGALSQNSMFYGSATWGTVAESVLGLEVALADGRLVRTGSGANRGGQPFFRHYGPDLTGLFLSDTGALGVKVEATIRLIREPACTGYASFAFDSFHDMVDAQTEIGRARLAAECFGLDPYLNGQRTIVKDLKSGLAALGGVIKAQASLARGLKEAASIAAAGASGFADGVRYSLHMTVDATHDADAAWRLREIKRIATAARGREIEPVIPKVIRAMPFKHVGEFLVGHAGERWVPIHACLPASRLKPVFEATMAYFAGKAGVLERFNIRTSHLTGSSGTDMIFEPAFYYPDALKAFHLRNLEAADAERYRRLPAVAGASEAVAGMLADLARIFMEHGAVHQQLGRFYPYRESLQPDTWALLEGIKRVVDPGRLMNPGSLGL